MGLCALHSERGVRIPEGSQLASAGCASLQGMAWHHSIGAWEDVTGIFAVGRENALWQYFHWDSFEAWMQSAHAQRL